MQRKHHSFNKPPTIVVYPTESFYALGVDAREGKAIEQLFRLKHREPGKPVALIAADLKQVKKYFVMMKDEEQLGKKYWPGALTILLKPRAPTSPRPSLGRRGVIAADALFPPPRSARRRNALPSARRGPIRIGVRVPAHAGARRLAKRIGAPITATSANISGQPPTKSARKIKKLFPDILVVPGRCGTARQPSTIIEIQNKKIHIIRQGATHSVKGDRI